MKVGDYVLIYPWTGCEDCGMCRSREDNMCEESLAKAYGIGKDGGSVTPLTLKCLMPTYFCINHGDFEF